MAFIFRQKLGFLVSNADLVFFVERLMPNEDGPSKHPPIEETLYFEQAHDLASELLTSVALLFIFVIPSLPVLGLAYLIRPLEHNEFELFYTSSSLYSYKLLSIALYSIAGGYLIMVSVWFIVTSAIPMGYAKEGWYHQMLQVS